MKNPTALITDTNIALYDISIELWHNYGIKSHRVDDIPGALQELSKNAYHLVVIVENKNMRNEVQNSLKLFQELTDAPIVIASTDFIDPDYRVRTFEIGADEVWEMPGTIQEAVAKGHALIRRHLECTKKAKKLSTVIFNQYIVLSVEHRIVLIKGQKVDLKRKEFDMLHLLIAYPGRVFTYNQIFREVWGEEYVDDPHKVINNLASKLRQKLNIVTELPDYIKVVHGVGYKFDFD